MNRVTVRILGLLVVLMSLHPVILPLLSVSWAESDNMVEVLVSLGEPAPEAVKFKIWTNKEEGEAFHPDDRAIIFLSAERQSYVTILAVGSDGIVTVVLPNKLMRDSLIQPHTLYALFGDDAPVRLTTEEGSSNERLVLYLTPTPLVLEPLKISEGRAWLILGHGEQKDVQILKDKLQTIAKNKDFNRAVILFPDEKGNPLKIKLTEVPHTVLRKGIPAPESSIPETLTGASGLKPLRKIKLKE